MKYSKQDIEQLDKVSRLKLINAITGIKPANLIGTVNNLGQTNLAVFSSVVHLGSAPALLGFVSRPRTADVGHTYRNIIENGRYTINHIHPEFIKNAHYTSAKFAREISEFERCGLAEEYINESKAPFVKESRFKMEMQFKEAIDIPLNGTVLVIGEVIQVILPDEVFQENDIDLEVADSVGISGLNSYYSLEKLNRFPYARREEVPNF